MRKFLISFLASNGAFLIICMVTGELWLYFGSQVALIVLFPLLIGVAIVFGLLLNRKGLIEENPAILGFPVLLGLIGVAVYFPLEEAFSYSIESDPKALFEQNDKSLPGYVNMADLDLCNQVDTYNSLAWNLRRKGFDLGQPGNKNSYFGYDAVLKLNPENKSPAVILYIENVVIDQDAAPPRPEQTDWKKFCKDEVEWFKLIRAAKDPRVEFVRQSSDEIVEHPRMLPVYVNTSSPLTDRWIWGSAFALLLIINSLPAVWMIGRK